MKPITFPLDVPYIDQLLNYIENGTYQQISESQHILVQFSSSVQAIKYVYDLITQSTQLNTHLFAYNIVQIAITSNNFPHYPQEIQQKLFQSIQQWHSTVTPQTHLLLSNKIIQLFIQVIKLNNNMNMFTSIFNYNPSLDLFKLSTIIAYVEDCLSLPPEIAEICINFSQSCITVYEEMSLKVCSVCSPFVGSSAAEVLISYELPYVIKYPQIILSSLISLYRTLFNDNPQLRQQHYLYFIQYLPRIPILPELSHCLLQLIPQNNPSPEVLQKMMLCIPDRRTMKYFEMYVSNNQSGSTPIQQQLLSLLIHNIPIDSTFLFVESDANFIDLVDVGGNGYESIISTLAELCNSGIGDDFLSFITEKVLINNCDMTILRKVVWAISGISSNISYTLESKLFVKTLSFLLLLFNEIQSLEKKRLVVENIMFLVSKHPRFLSHNPKILLSVVKKIFEFCSDSEYNIQRVSVYCLIKLCSSCGNAIVNSPEILKEIYNNFNIGLTLVDSLCGGFFSGLSSLIPWFTDSLFLREYISTIVTLEIQQLDNSLQYYVQGITPDAIRATTPHLMAVTHFLSICTSLPQPPEVNESLVVLRKFYVNLMSYASKDTQMIETIYPITSQILSYFSLMSQSTEYARSIFLNNVIPMTPTLPLSLISPALISACSKLIIENNTSEVVESVFNNVIRSSIISSSLNVHDLVFSFVKDTFLYCFDFYSKIEEVIMKELVPELINGIKRDNKDAIEALEILGCEKELDISVIEFVLIQTLKGKDCVSLLKVLVDGCTINNFVEVIAITIHETFGIQLEDAGQLAQEIYTQSRQGIIPFRKLITRLLLL
ncbi:Importin N-terminal domain-containing protein [Entamoeba marina]